MKWPFVWRTLHDLQLQAIQECNTSLRFTIEALNYEIAERDTRISVLTAQLTDAKCNHYTPKSSSEPIKVIPKTNSRGGWRHRAQQASESTIPKPKDSMQALQDKVKREGGTTDAV